MHPHKRQLYHCRCNMINKCLRKQRIFVTAFQILPPTCFGRNWPHCINLDTFHYNWPHRTGHNPYTPITQSIAWVAYKATMTLWRWQLFVETCRGRMWNALTKTYYFIIIIIILYVGHFITILQDARFNIQEATTYISLVHFFLNPLIL
jgi:hypothetical protein